MIYLNDVFEFGQTFEQELESLAEVSARFRTANHKPSLKKCSLFQGEIQYLDHVVSDHGVRTDPKKVSAVKD